MILVCIVIILSFELAMVEVLEGLLIPAGVVENRLLNLSLASMAKLAHTSVWHGFCSSLGTDR